MPRIHADFNTLNSEPIDLTLVGQVGAAGAAAGAARGRERATWSRSAASSGGGALHDHCVH
jgi:hypothetical protein